VENEIFMSYRRWGDVLFRQPLLKAAGQPFCFIGVSDTLFVECGK
jgi:hypothetical protein